MSLALCSGSLVTCTSPSECANDANFNEWINSWKRLGSCNDWIQLQTYVNNNQSMAQLDTAGYANAQSAMSQSFTKYQSVGYKVTGPNSTGYSPLQNNLLTACSTVPGVCDPFLKSYCSGQTREAIGNDPQLLNWCGCYAPPPDIPGVKISPQCDVLCDIAGTIKLPQVTPEQGFSQLGFAECLDDVCVISDVTVNAAGSSITNVNFKQMCSNCRPGVTCKCIIDGVKSFSKIGDPATFKQSCGPDSVCVQNGKIVACSEVSDPAPSATIVNKQPPTWFWILLVTVVVIVIILVVIMKIGRH
jgi:hypothetical protein